jgi:hypothetical protein
MSPAAGWSSPAVPATPRPKRCGANVRADLGGPARIAAWIIEFDPADAPPRHVDEQDPDDVEDHAVLAQLPPGGAVARIRSVLAVLRLSGEAAAPALDDEVHPDDVLERLAVDQQAAAAFDLLGDDGVAGAPQQPDGQALAAAAAPARPPGA